MPTRLCLALALLCAALPLAAQSLAIPQIADGAGWQTTLVITNTGSSTAVYSLVFHQSTGNGATTDWAPPFAELDTTRNLSLAAGQTTFLHTLGASSTLAVGWGELQAPAAVQAYAVFASGRGAGNATQEGTAPAVAPATRALIPFDNTNGLVTSVALINHSSTAANLTANLKTSSSMTTGTPLAALPALGHKAAALETLLPATAGKRGLVEIVASTGSVAAIALRFNPSGAFTASPTYAQSGSAIIVPGAASKVQTLSLESATLTSGSTLTATVTLTAGAPAGGANVTLSSNSTAASVPAMVTILPGLTSTTFPVSAGPVATDTLVTLTAQYGGASATAQVTVKTPSIPPPTGLVD